MQTRTNLKKAFWKLYEKKSIEKITVKEITDLAGYNRGTFYLYYKDIYQITDEAEQELMEEIEAYIEQRRIRKKDKDKKEMLETMLETMLQSYHKYQKYLDILFGPHGNLGFFNKWKEQLKRIAGEEAKKRGIFEKEEVMELFLEYHVSGAIALARYFMEQRPDISKESLLELLQIFERFHMPPVYDYNLWEKDDSTEDINC